MTGPKPRILGIAGSLRAGSFNRKLLAVAAQELTSLGAEVDVVDLKALALPVYDGDDEAATGLPPGAVALRERIARADGLLIATPEYNHSIPGGLKNAIDWASRSPKQPLRDKVLAICGASTGAFGTVRSQYHLRQTVTPLGVWLCPSSVLLPFADKAFDEQGALSSPDRLKELRALLTQLLDEVKRRHALPGN